MLDTKHIISYISGMNKLPIAKRVQILSMLCEGSSMRSISRVCDVSINTVAKILEDAGKICMQFHDETVRNVSSKRVQMDEIWSFTAAKQKNVASMKKPIEGAGDTWTWTAIDADSKLILQWYVGDRSGETAKFFVNGVADRLATRVQLTTDGLKAYLDAVEGAFGADVDYAQLIKLYGASPETAKGRYSPAECTGIIKTPIEGGPDQKHISTSYVERQNLTMRMSMCRFTRLTNAFSKKLESHIYAISLYFVFYNFCRIHKTLKITPAMAAGLTGTLMNMEDVVALIDAAAPKPGRSKTYKKRADTPV